MPIKKTWDEKLWGKLISNGDCLEWTGYLNSGGYGVLSIGNRKTGLAHRKAWELINGEIPIGLMVLHKCDNTKCCNPDHLFLGNNEDNMKDMANKGRGRSRPGEFSPNAKLTQEDAREIRRLYFQENVSQQKIADIYKISQVGVSQIVLNKKYKEDALLPKTLI